MQRSRTIKTLAALFAALTIGTFVLLVLETRPASVGSILPLLARQNHDEIVAAAVRQTAVPILQTKWRRIVLHDGICDMTGDPHEDCHFVILGPDAGRLDGALRPTRRWRQQARGAHITVPGHDFNADSIGVCIAGDLADNEPSTAQLKTLKALITTLQRKCDIPAHRVYLHSDLTASPCPGDRFPVAAFRAQLIGARR